MNKFGITKSLAIGECHPLFRSLIWVAAARSDDENRLALTYIHVEREGLDYHIVATDGKRMHVSTFDPGMFDEDFESIEAGSYEVVAKSAKFIVVAAAEDAPKFPNWRALMPDRGDRETLDERVCARTIAAICIRSGVLLAADFLVEAIGYGCGYKKDSYVQVDFAADPSGHGPFLIQHELGRAVVMPMMMRSDSFDKEDPKDDAEATPEIPSIAAHFDIKPSGNPVDNPDTGVTVDPLEASMIYDSESIEHIFLEGLVTKMGPRHKAARQKLIDKFILKHDENAFLKVWSYGKRTQFYKPIMEEIAVICREIDPIGDFIV